MSDIIAITLQDGAELCISTADLLAHAELLVQLALERVRDQEGADVARVAYVDRRGVHVVFLGAYSPSLGGRVVRQRRVALDADLDAGGKAEVVHELLWSGAPCPSCGEPLGDGCEYEHPEPDVGVPGGWHGCETCIPYARRWAEEARTDMTVEALEERERSVA